MLPYDSNTIAYFRGVLLTQRVELMARMQRNGSPILVEELKDADRMDRPQIMERHHAVLAGEQANLRDIENALQKCEDGTYGLCEDCHTSILLARLEVIPTASRCLPCQVKHNPHDRPCDMVLLHKAGIYPSRIFAKNTARHPVI